jgi:hypothetical protein
MKRTLALIIAAFVLIVLFAWLTIAEVVHPPAWRVALDEYVVSQSELLPERIAVVSVARVRRPSLIVLDTDQAVFGNDMYTLRQLPFPPKKAWGVVIQRVHLVTRMTIQQVLFVAMYQDLHYADWVVHESMREPFDQEFLDQLAAMGCDLNLQP